MNNIQQLSTDVVGYNSIADWLEEELLVLDVRLEYALNDMTAKGVQQASSYAGQYFSSDAAYALLNEQEQLSLEVDQRLLLSQLEERIAARVERSVLPVQRLRSQFQLTTFEWRAIIICFAPHYRAKYWRLYGYIHDDMTKQLVSLQLLLQLSCYTKEEYRLLLERMLDASSTVRQLIIEMSPLIGDNMSILKQPLTLHHSLIGFLQGITLTSDVIGMKYSDHKQLATLAPLLIQDHLQQQLRRYVQAAREQRRTTKTNHSIMLLYGKAGAGKTLHSQYVAQYLQKTYIEIDLSCAPVTLLAFRHYIEEIFLEVKLKEALLVFRQLPSLIDPLKTDGEAGGADIESNGTGDSVNSLRWALLIEYMNNHPDPIIIHSNERLSSMMQLVQPLEVSLATISMEEASSLWMRLAEQYGFDALERAEADRLAAKFRFTPGQITSAIALAVKENIYLSDASEMQLDNAQVSKRLHAAAYRSIHHQLSLQANKMEHTFGWSDLILPDESLYLLQQACHRMKDRYRVMQEWGFERILPYGRGVSMMFTGPPGTGKTMSALIMAREMDAELYRVDLSRVVSKYIGETEKNLRVIFEQAQQSGAILFFDEADALFGKRSEVKDAHDKYANMETAFLLQKMEEYDGLTILATNLSQHLDDAFIRRIQFIIKFPFPDKQQREQLWRSAMPEEMQGSSIDFVFLADTFELSGGPIKNIVLTAAYLAAHAEQQTIEMKHCMEAAIQEYKKSGKLLLRDRLGEYAKYWRG